MNKLFLDNKMKKILLDLDQEKFPDPTELSPKQARKIANLINARWNHDLPEMDQVNVIWFKNPEGNKIKARLFTPKILEKGLIFFIHGGGFALCNIETHERLARLLAIEMQCTVLSIDYRLAPENPYPAGLNDCIESFRQIKNLKQNYPWINGPITIVGDSAGANLALSLILNEQVEKRSFPAFAMLFYGVYDSNFQTKSYLECGNGPGLTCGQMIRYFDWYAPQEMRENPLISPLKASDEALNALPPLYLNGAEVDPLRSDTEKLATRLHGLGRKDPVRIFKGVTHGFMQMTSQLPVACEAIKEVSYYFRNFLETFKKINSTIKG